MRKYGILFLTAPLFALEMQPWFPPLWEFQGNIDYLYNYQDPIQTPLGNFNLSNPVNNAIFGLDLTFWPNWNGEIELLVGSNPASDVGFSYKATRVTGRYQWFEDSSGDLFSLTSGVTLFAVRSSFLTATSTWFHGNVNAEFHLALGKEFTRHYEWFSRLWGYVGYGIANRGNPWWHSVAALEIKPRDCLTVSTLMELVYGMGNHDINPIEPFPGYAGINHQSVNLGLSAEYKFFPWGNLSLNGWYNVHAFNFPEHFYGIGVTLLIPFSF